MSVFLRWGVFGILGTAALVYAYKVNERNAQNREARLTSESAEEEVAAPSQDASDQDLSEDCRVRILIVERALQARAEGAPVDRLLRTPEIAWQEDAELRRQFELLAKSWYEAPQDADPAAARAKVLESCEPATPAP